MTLVVVIGVAIMWVIRRTPPLPSGQPTQERMHVPPAYGQQGPIGWID